MKKIVCLIGISLPFAGSPLLANGDSAVEGIPPQNTPGPLQCVQLAARTFGLPASLVLAVKRTESSLSFSYVERVNGNDSRDLGVMQINTLWLETLNIKFHLREKDLRDPCVNISVGTWILSNCIQRHGVLDGIGCYHTGPVSYANKARGVKYISKVTEHWWEIVLSSEGCVMNESEHCKI